MAIYTENLLSLKVAYLLKGIVVHYYKPVAVAKTFEGIC
jgi:hypothetical protein